MSPQDAETTLRLAEIVIGDHEVQQARNFMPLNLDTSHLPQYDQEILASIRHATAQTLHQGDAEVLLLLTPQTLRDAAEDRLHLEATSMIEIRTKVVVAVVAAAMRPVGGTMNMKGVHGNHEPTP
jgi:hypothetical protein